MLALLNERLFDNGAARVRVPLRTAVAASNEGPESDDLDALFDRFLLRKVVAPLSDEGVLTMLLGQGTSEASLDGALAAELGAALDAVRAAAPRVVLSRHSALLLRDARSFVRESGGGLSDRRLLRSAELLRASAAAHGRASVTVVDAAAVLPHVLWASPDDAPALAAWLEDELLPEGGAAQLTFLLASIRARAVGASGAGCDETLREDARSLAAAALEAAAEMVGHACAIDGARGHLFLPPQQAAGLRQRLLPEARARAQALRRIARDAAEAQLAIESAAPGALEALGARLERGADGEEEDDDESGGSSSADGFSTEELAWGRKEAKARLAPEAFREWRKVVKKSK